MSSSAITAFSNEFFTAFSNIDYKKQTKVADALQDFRKNPSFADREYHPIPNAQDSFFYLTPAAKTGYTFVVFKPENEEFYALLWVDKEDAASEWGRDRRCDIDVMTGKVSIIKIDTDQGAGTEEEKQEDSSKKYLFSGFTKDQLLQIGVPQQNLRKVYSVYDREGLKELKAFVSSLTFECLCLLVAGDSYEDVLTVYIDCTVGKPGKGNDPKPKEANDQKPKEANDQKPKEANNQNSKKPNDQRIKYEFYFTHSPEFFTLNPDEEELRGMLDQPLAKWRVFLHPSQKKLVNKDWNGSVRVMGGAGTGKTVVALHRALYLAKNNPDAKILLTTFSKTLATDLERQLKSLCVHGENKNIEVRHIDSWVKRFLNQEGIDFQPLHTKREEEVLWEEAMTLLPRSIVKAELRNKAFLQEEWEQVVEWHGITTEKDYLKITRRGRKGTLTRKERLDLWPVFEKFRRSLEERGYMSFIDATRKAREILESRGEQPYSFVIVDESQDITEQGVRLLRALVPVGKNDIFLVGDPYQRIYGYPVIFSDWKINIVGRSKKLWLNYRTTEEIRREALQFVPDSLGDEDKLDGRNVSVTFGPKVEKRRFRSYVAAIEAIADEISDLEALNEKRLNLSEICVVARTQEFFDDIMKKIFINREIKYYNLAGVSDVAIEGVRFATMHRVKGLEFYHVFILEDEKNLNRLDKNNEDLLKENLLRYVAATRAKMSLHIFTY